MSQMKQSKFMKEFKDLRSYAFDELIRNLDFINKNGRFNNFSLSNLNVPIQSSSLDQAHIQVFMLNLFLKEQEKQALWRNMTSTQSPQAGDQDDHPDIQSSSEYKTFENLFNLINSPAKLRMIAREKLLRPFQRLFEQLLLRN